jgi:hypothetical protein
MQHGVRAAIMSGLLAAASGAAPISAALAQAGGGSGGAAGQSGFTSQFPGDLTTGLARPNVRPPPMPQTYRSSPPPGPWGTQPAPGGRQLPNGLMTEQQARDRIAAAGFTDVRPLRPTYMGSWTGYAAFRGSSVRATIDSQGNISTE